MCGICGFLKFDGNISDADLSYLKRMNAKLTHRGPDANNTLVFDNVALGFSRLSIIGLDNGMQPISNEDKSIVLICNGEIFNYIELKKELVCKGHTFRTSTDVEVIVHLYEEYGMNFLSKINGQFAFALYDKKEKKLICVRDQMGIIPLFYTLTANHFIFGSEIKAILEHPLVNPEVDLVGLDQIFTFPGLVSPRTMFKNISSLENGHYLVLDQTGRVQNYEYWDLIYPEGEIPAEKSEEFYINRLEELFENSIRLRLRADVPSGIYLSGGLDSSMISMKVNHIQPEVRKEAFSIDFAESELSETQYQLLVANASNSILNKKTFFYDDISKRLKQAIYHSECPIKETYNTASLALSEATRMKGIKVILSGEGSDELFAGYVGYRFDQMRQMNLVENPSCEEEKELRFKLWGDSSFFYESNFKELEGTKRSLFSEQVNANYQMVNCLNHHVIHNCKIKNRDILHKRAYIDYKLRLVDHLVADHGDKMALANSVEVRYPFLDKDIIEFSTQVPQSYKLHNFTEKYILKQMARRFVPQQIINREKFHFVAPGSPHLLQNRVEYVEDILSYSQIKRQGYFNPDKIEQLKKTYAQEGFFVNAPFERDLLIIVITFGILLEQFFE